MPSKYPQLKVEKRKTVGRKVKALRKEGILPANLYGKDIKSQNLQLAQKELLKVFREVGETGLVELIIAGQKEAHLVLVHEPQKEPVSGSLLHVDFRQVNLKQKLVVNVPVEMAGEAPGVAVGGVLVQLLKEIEVEALPTDLPEELIVNIGELEKIGQSVSVADLVYDKTKVSLKIEDPEALVAKIEAPAKEEVEVKPAAEAPPAGGEDEAKPVEGEEPAEGVKPAEVKPTAESPEKEEKK